MELIAQASEFYNMTGMTIPQCIGCGISLICVMWAGILALRDKDWGWFLVAGVVLGGISLGKF